MYGLGRSFWTVVCACVYSKRKANVARLDCDRKSGRQKKNKTNPHTLIPYLFRTKGDLNFWREMLSHVKKRSSREGY
jgi:hypothetical protein